jgi:hypothetical protein
MRPLRAWRREKVDALFVTGGGFFVALERGQAYEPEVPAEVREWINPALASPER